MLFVILGLVFPHAGKRASTEAGDWGQPAADNA